MGIRLATESDAAAIASIYNQGIRSRRATFETEKRTPAERRQWLRQHGAHHPVLVITIPTGPGGDEQVAGWAAISPYSSRACYQGIGEFSVYVDAGHRGKGLGRRLLDALIHEAAELGYWKLIGRLFPDNAASRALCRSCGFREVGILRRHGQLDGQWLDNVLVERLLY